MKDREKEKLQEKERQRQKSRNILRRTSIRGRSSVRKARSSVEGGMELERFDLKHDDIESSISPVKTNTETNSKQNTIANTTP